MSLTTGFKLESGRSVKGEFVSRGRTTLWSTAALGEGVVFKNGDTLTCRYTISLPRMIEHQATPWVTPYYEMGYKGHLIVDRCFKLGDGLRFNKSGSTYTVIATTPDECRPGMHHILLDRPLEEAVNHDGNYVVLRWWHVHEYDSNIAFFSELVGVPCVPCGIAVLDEKLLTVMLQ